MRSICMDSTWCFRGSRRYAIGLRSPPTWYSASLRPESTGRWKGGKSLSVRHADEPGFKQARESLSALLHDYVVVPLEKRPRDRSSQIHPALGGAYLPFIADRGHAVIGGEEPAPGAF